MVRQSHRVICPDDTHSGYNVNIRHHPLSRKGAEIKKFNCFIGHGTPAQIAEFLSGLNGLKEVLIVHSDPGLVQRLAAHYREAFPDISFTVPRLGEIYLFTD